MPIPRLATCVARPLLAILLASGLAGIGTGCSAEQTASDSEIVRALNLKDAGKSYEMGGDPFCRIDDLLNEPGEVEDADRAGGHDFVIASPNGEVGVQAHPPFAPDCARRAKD